MDLLDELRPKTLDSFVCETPLFNKLDKFLKNPSSHAILLTGVSGGGKTSYCRIFASFHGAKAPLDYVEVNCADNTGVDFAREWNSYVSKRPFGKTKVLVLDECHQLSSAAQNALLKSLEDFPSWLYIFLVSTQPDSLLKTIKTRCSFQVDFTPTSISALRDDDHWWDALKTTFGDKPFDTNSVHSYLNSTSTQDFSIRELISHVVHGPGVTAASEQDDIFSDVAQAIVHCKVALGIHGPKVLEMNMGAETFRIKMIHYLLGYIKNRLKSQADITWQINCLSILTKMGTLQNSDGKARLFLMLSALQK